MDVGLFVDQLRNSPAHVGQMVHVEELPYREAAHGELAHDLHPDLSAALREHGLLPLYTHQATAVDAVLDGSDVAVVTPAASGKSLCYNIPVAQSLLTDPSTRALYLFPTKALAHDQLRGLQGLLPSKLASRVAIFDGDTPSGERAAVRRSAQVVLTNPDMLHYGILPNHRAWGRLLPSLKYVVIDEAHVYRGIFGSHVANVLRRLRRLCRHYGTDPIFILCSAPSRMPASSLSASWAARAPSSPMTAHPTVPSISSSGTHPSSTRSAARGPARGARHRG